MDIKPIKSEADYQAALEEIEGLMDAKAGTADGDRLEVLTTLVEAHEAKHHPIDAPDPIEAIKFRMEQQGLTRKDLEPLIGPRGRVAEILNSSRPLTLRMIRNLRDKLQIPAEVLIGESGKRRTKRKSRAA
ncbi:MAG: transcriptional regulator [Kiloniellales bacterium]